MSTVVQEDPCAFVPNVGQLSSSLPLVDSGWMTITFPKTSSTSTGSMYFKDGNLSLKMKSLASCAMLISYDIFYQKASNQPVADPLLSVTGGRDN